MPQYTYFTALESLLFFSEMPPPTRFYNWSKLPDELKVEILSHYLTFTDPITAVHHQYLMETILDPLILTGSRDFVALALKTYYNKNTFELHLNHPIEMKIEM
jgi:hypothetical protein